MRKIYSSHFFKRQIRKMLVGRTVKSSDLTYISQAQLREASLKIANVLRINEPKPNAKMVSLKEAVDLMMEVRKEQLLKKVEKLWNEKYSIYAATGSGQTMGLVRRRPDFKNMSPKQLPKEYLKLLREKHAS